MPHLSPMHWIMAITSITFTLLLMASSFWWTQNPMFSTHTTKHLKKSKIWNW